jgi:hypothetical protein
MGVGGQRQAPATFIPGNDPVPIVQKAGWAPGPVWTGAENLASLEFDPRTVQPVGSHYTNYATRPTVVVVTQFVFVSLTKMGYYWTTRTPLNLRLLQLFTYAVTECSFALEPFPNFCVLNWFLFCTMFHGREVSVIERDASVVRSSSVMKK